MAKKPSKGESSHYTQRITNGNSVRSDNALLFGKVEEIAITEDEFLKMHPAIQKHLMALELARFDLADKLDAAQRAAVTDGLTGLTNAEGLKQHMAGLHARKTPSKVSIVFLDMNDFKAINTIFGHPIGDAAIVAAAEYFKTHMRPEDTVSCVARKGGDEVVATMQCSAAEATAKMLRLREDFSKHMCSSIKDAFMTQSKAKGQLGKERAWERAVIDFKAALAEKHDNPEIADRDLAFSFSFGTRELSVTELEKLATDDPKKFKKVFAQAIAEGDDLMKEDKGRHVAAMKARRPADDTVHL